MPVAINSAYQSFLVLRRNDTAARENNITEILRDESAREQERQANRDVARGGGDGGDGGGAPGGLDLGS